MTWFLRSWFVVLGIVSACGGRAVVEPNGQDGGGGTGGANGVALSACNDWCEVYTERCVGNETCRDGCLERASYLSPCESEYEALLQCSTSHPPLDSVDCTKPPVDCETQQNALEACVYPAGPCEPGACVTGNGLGAPALACDFVCGGVVYTSACGEVGSSGDFPLDCTCQIDGESVGACQSVTSIGVSGFGCCSVYFATSK